MTQFRSRRRGGVLVELPAEAAAMLDNLTRQLVELLSDGEPLGPAELDPLEAMLDLDAPREAPTDPALLRLLPTAHLDDEEVAAEFRRFTERGLREGKVRDALAVLTGLGSARGDDLSADPAGSTESDGGVGGIVELELDAAQAREWMRCLTDLRLTLAARLEVGPDDEEFWAQLPDDDPRSAVYDIYGWLGYLLESLIDAVRR